MSKVKRIDLSEFRDEGYLQELNRQFLHPLGLALEVLVDVDGRVLGFSGVWDCRDDPEGIIYAEGLPNSDKASRIAQLERARKPERHERLGYWIQPVTEID
jgi:hypothetical protein